MNPAQLLSHFDRIGEVPDAIPRLRRFILDLAVRGKLVEQDPRDEPASEILKRIQEERERLSTNSSVRKTKIDGQVDFDEMPFELPKSWVFTSLGEVSRYGLPDKVNSSKEITANTWVLDLEDIEKDSSRLVERVVSLSRQFKSSKTRFKKGDVLFGKLRPYLNKVLVADADGVCTTEIVPIRGFSNVVPEYIRLVLKSPLTMKQVDRLMYGMKMPRLGTEDALGLNFPLPPLAEQHRIVAKVDELMALCDRLETAQTEQESRRDRLVASSLHHLNNGADADAFQEYARFYFNHLPRLTTRPDHIKQLRQTILNLAIHGKLVPQDPTDEPATVLLQKTTAEKEQLMKEGKIKKEKATPKITEDEKPFAVPKGWEWCRVWNVAKLITSGSRDWAKYYSEKGAIFVTMGNLSKGQYALRMNTIRYVNPPKDGEGSRTKLEENDLLISITGDVGNLGLVPKDFGEAYINQHTCLLRFMPECQNRFFPELMRSPWAKFQFDAPQRGIKNSFRLDDVGEMLIPLPPLAEQHRIVAKVDELMALCDQLETQLTTTQSESHRLLEVLLHDPLSA